MICSHAVVEGAACPASVKAAAAAGKRSHAHISKMEDLSCRLVGSQVTAVGEHGHRASG